MNRILCLCACVVWYVSALPLGAAEPLEISGRYPHLAMFNHQGECGTGAVVWWADRLWVITYGPHLPSGSDDKLYEIDAKLNRVTRPESVGGTPANRMIHRESQQLNIGPYFIDAKRNVRVIPPSKMFGRLTATARHLTDPANKLYIYDMEGLLYEVDVHSLEAKLLFKRPVPGWHGKGGYSGQGRLVVANNGESPARSVNPFKPFDYLIDPKPKSPEDAGVLCEWDGKTWRLVERRQFTDVTGPGGILGPPSDTAPLWSIGWDRRSLLLALCDGGQWQTFRLPMADYSYTAKNGWNTEWPRIREVTGGKYLMNLHGTWFDFPPTFASGKTAGLRPVGDHLKITADFCAMGDRIVFGCDDTLVLDFRPSGVGELQNRLTGQSNSNLWFTTWQNLSRAGRPAGIGGPWLGDDVQADQASTAYLLAGYTDRVLHLTHHSAAPVTFTVEIDRAGDGRWTPYKTIKVEPDGYAFHVFPAELSAEWVRLRIDRDAAGVTAYFHYGPGGGAAADPRLFAALADVGEEKPWIAAVLRSEGDDLGTLAVRAQRVDGQNRAGEPRFYQVDADMLFRPAQADSASARFLEEKARVTQRVVESDDASVIVTAGKLKVRLPKSHAEFDAPTAAGWPRALRQVVADRALLHASGTFYVLPRDDSNGLRGIKPVCTHRKRIMDFCSWRGMLVLAGCRALAKADGHSFAPPDGEVGLWFGDVDDLWKLGKPIGRGGPWLKTPVEPGALSDPYLMLGYDRKTLELSHDAQGEVGFAILVDVAGNDNWLPYATIRVPAGQTIRHAFPAGYSAYWVRLKADRACTASATFTYE